MANDFSKLARDLRGFNANAEVAKALRKELAKPVPAAKENIRKNAIAILPKAGGLGDWVAATKITHTVRLAGHTVSIKLIGGRSSATGKKSDVRSIDEGSTRHPSWGRRGRGQWHAQAVTAGFFTDPVRDDVAWLAAAERAVDLALEKLRRD